MADQAWKAWEREVAKRLNDICEEQGFFNTVTRTGPQGKNLPDVVNAPLLNVEAKLQGRMSLKKADLDQAFRNKLQKENLTALFLKERKTNRQVVVMPAEDFYILYNHALVLRSTNG